LMLSSNDSGTATSAASVNCPRWLRSMLLCGEQLAATARNPHRPQFDL
jgi:hypothetical protein